MMIPTVIPILDDEFVGGWIERLAAANHIPVLLFLEHYFGISNALYDSKRKQIRNIGGLLRIISNPSLNYLGLDTLLIKHTLAPVAGLFMDACNSSMYIEAMINDNNQALLNKMIVNVQSDHNKYCPQCVAEDNNNYGYSIIHVPHQYRGVCACWKHGLKLTDSHKDDTRIRALPEEIRTAYFIKKIYDCGFLGNIHHIKKMCITDSAITSAYKLVKSGEFQNILDYACIGNEKDFYQMLLSTNQLHSYREKLVRAISQIVNPADIKMFLQPEPVSKVVASCKEILNISGSTLISIKHPFVTVRCGQCGREYTSFHQAIRIGVGCPHCSLSSNKTNVMEKMFEKVIQRDGFTIVGNDKGYLKIVRHKCGELLQVKPRYVLNKGHLLCPVCESNKEPERTTKDILCAFKRIGTRKVMGCGMEAEIIFYNNARNMDVKFSNGFIRRNVEYAAFLRGNILPNNSISERKVAEYVGKKKEMNCGEVVEIIAYLGYGHVDVRFKNGVIRKNVCITDFNKGILVPRGKEKWLNEKKRMNCGIDATIIEFRGKNDIDVLFGDGEIKEGVSIKNFINGTLGEKHLHGKAKWEGQKMFMRCGMEATIIQYKTYNDITVEFSDGSICEHVCLQSFKKGMIRPQKRINKSIPYINNTVQGFERKNKPVPRTRYAELRVGERNLMNCGLEAEILEYRKCNDIDIRFEDASIRTHVAYREFKKGSIKPVPRTRYAELRVGERNIMNCGLEAEILEYRKCNDIDIRFEDGSIRTHVAYREFKKGSIKPVPRTRYAEFRVGERNIMNCGLEAEILEYRSYNDIDIRFEDGSIRTHATYCDFKQGAIIPKSYNKYAMSRVGEKKVMNCTLEAEILEYRNYNDIDIRFEDGSIRTHVQYKKFKKGEIVPISIKDYSAIRVGEKSVMNCGLEAEILEYRSTHDIDIRFEDGSIRTHVAYHDFISGAIIPKSYNKYEAIRVGEKSIMNCGLQAEIIKYNNACDLDVRFENGTVRKHVSYQHFKNGSIRPVARNNHPNRQVSK